MLIPQTALKSSEPRPKPGDKMASEVQDENGKVLYRAIYELTETTPPKGTTGLALAAKLLEEQWPDAAYKASLAEAPKRVSSDGDTAVNALRLAWDIIKDNRAITDLKGASTAILNPKNMNPFDYQHAREGTSPQYYWWGYNWPVKSWKAFEIWLRIAGVYGAQAPKDIPAGEYIPSLYFDFPQSPWVEWGLTMNANASVMPPWNAGRPDNCIAQCDLVATVTVSSVVDPSRPQGFKFVANGHTGFQQK